MKIAPKEKIDKDIFKKIFLDHWPSFKEKHSRYDDPQYTMPVQKMLIVGRSGGYTEYRCVYCGWMHFG